MSGAALLAVLFVAGLVIYFLPTLVAKGRAHHNLMAIFMLNLLLGWTLLGWVVAMVWAYTRSKEEVAHAPTPAAPIAPALSTQRLVSDEKACPFCAETVKAAALVCKHCGRDLPAPAEASARTAVEQEADRLGVVWSPEVERYLWRGDFFKDLDAAVAYAKARV